MIQDDSTNKKENSFKVAVQMDDPKFLDKFGDSTLAIIEEALKRKFEVYIYLVQDLSLIKNSPVAYAKKVNNINIKNENFIELHEPRLLQLNTCNVLYKLANISCYYIFQVEMGAVTTEYPRLLYQNCM